MMKDLAWNLFKETGNVDIFLELKQLENIQNSKKTGSQKVEANEYSKNEGNSNF